MKLIGMNWYEHAKKVEAGRLRDFGIGLGAAVFPAASALAPMPAATTIPPQQPTPQVQPATQPATQPIPDMAPKQTLDLQRLMADLRRDEGYKHTRYADHLGKPTIGIGHLITPNDPVIRAVCGQDAAAIMSGRKSLTDQQISAIFQQDLLATRKRVHIACAKYEVDFDSLSPVLQATLLKMTFQMGNVAGFPNMMRAIKAGRFNEVPKHMLDSKWFREDTPDRAWRTAKDVADHYQYEMPPRPGTKPAGSLPGSKPR